MTDAVIYEPAVVKAPRLLALLLRLQASGSVTARQLAVDLEVSERTIHRDVEALAEAGVPVYAERGSRGGITLSEGYRKALTQLDAADLQSLLVMSADPLADLGLGNRRARIADQLLGSLSHAERESALHARERVFVDPGRWYLVAQPSETLRVLREASWADRSVDVAYADRGGNQSARTLDPLGLVSKAGLWYLVARTGEGLRTFRVDRISSVVDRGERFERPADFDLANYWNQSARRLEAPSFNFWITLRVAPHIFANVLAMTEHEVIDAQRCIVRVNYGTAADAAWRLFAWEDDAEVLEPASFIDDLARRAAAIVARYAGR